MAVVSYSSDVLCVHKTRLQLLYTDVQQLKMVQMVAQPIILRNLIYRSDAFACLFEKMCEILFKISHKRKVSIRSISGVLSWMFNCTASISVFNVHKPFFGFGDFKC